MTTALVHVEAMTAVEIFRPGAIDPILEQIEQEAREEAAKLDISTEANRKGLASLAYKVARSKTFIDNQRKALVADEKQRLQRIDAEGRRIWTRLESLQDEVRKPLTDWEEADKQRIANHEYALAAIQSTGTSISANWQGMDLRVIRGALVDIENDPRDWEEFGSKAAGIKAVAKEQISQAIAKRETYDAEQAELARLRAEAVEREQQEREERIAREAREKTERAAEYERQRIEREKADAEQRAKDAETRRLLAEQKAERNAKEAAERAEREKRAAIRAERERQTAKEQREREEQERREVSTRIRKRVLGEISAAIAELYIPGPAAEVIANAMADGKIPHVTVRF